jgi:hypothetical protein
MKKTFATLLLSSTICLMLAVPALADVPGRGTPAGTSVPNPGTQEQELANITFPAPYNVFEFPVTCGACHGGTIDQQAGHFGNWAGTSMASAMRDPVFRANQLIVNQGIKDLTGEDGAGNMCIRCHSPNAWYSGRTDPLLNGAADGSTVEHSILLSTDDEGILCEMCHRVVGGVTMQRTDLDPTDPVWNMLAGISDWPHQGDAFPEGPAPGNPYGDTALQINDGMTYAGKYAGSVDIYFNDLPLLRDATGIFSLGGLYTGQTYGIYPPGWLDMFGNDVSGEPVVNPDGSLPIHFELPIGPPLNPDGSYDYQSQSVSLEHPTTAGDFIRTSEFCGTCHDLTIPVLNHGMPEQRTYTEWKNSDYGRNENATTFKRCQDCHMPTMKHEYADDIPVTLNPDPALAGYFPYGKDRNPNGGTAFHKFAGANRDLPAMMQLLYPEVDLEVIGAPTGRDTRLFPGMMSSRDLAWDRARRNTEIFLNDAVDVTVSDPQYNQGSGKWEVKVRVTNNAGHSIPSGYPDGRRLFLSLQVTDNSGGLVYESGYYNEADATLYTDRNGTPFYRAHAPAIDSDSNAVMVYERITGTDAKDGAGNPTFIAAPSLSLLNNVICFDNRIPPDGYSYQGFSAAGVKFWDYRELGNGTVEYFENSNRYPDRQNYDEVTYSFAAPAEALLVARAEARWQTHTRQFMEFLRDADTSTLRPQGPPSIYAANYPLTPNYLSDVIGLADLTDAAGSPLNLRDNWGGVAYAAWLLSGQGKPFTVAADDTAYSVAPGPTVATAAPVDPFSVQVSWDPVAGAEGYILWVRYGVDTLPETDPASTASWDKLAVLDGAATSFVNDGLNVGKTYQYKVVAFNGKGMGPQSNVTSATTPADIPLLPANLNVVGVTDTTVTLSWFDQADDETGFVIERQDIPLLTADPWPPFVEIARIATPNNGAAGGVTFTDGINPLLPLEAGRSYNYRVAAYNATGISLWNDNGPVMATTLGLPAAASGLSAMVISGTDVALTWTDNSAAELGFRIERAADVDFLVNVRTVLVPADTTSWHDVSVVPETTYFYRVYSYNAIGDAILPSNTVQVTTPGLPPAAPSNLVADAPPVLPVQVNLSWTDNAVSETGFTVERSLDAAFATGLVSFALPADSVGYTDTAVEPKTTYYYRVSAFNDGGASTYSNAVSVVTPGEIPQAPSALLVTKVGNKAITLSWRDNSTNEQGFAIERSLDGAVWNLLAETGMDVTSYKDSGLQRHTTYWYRLRAFNADGYSEYSETVSATTK